MEVKWFMIFLAVGVVIMGVGTSIDAKYTADCKVAAIQANKTAAEIIDICK